MKRMPGKTENSWLWLTKQLSGAFVIILIIVHLVVNHLVADTGLLSYSDVVVYVSNPWIALMESVFLITVIGHSLLGLRSVILDFGPVEKVMRIIDTFLVALGIVASLYGIWLTVTVGSTVL